MGGVSETALASSTYAPFTWRLLTFTEWNWKCHVIILIKTGSGGVCCPNALGLVRTVRQIPQANALGIWLPVSHAPSCIGTTNPSRTGLNPINLGPGFFRQNTSGYALGVLTPKASPSGWVFSQAQHPMIKTYSHTLMDSKTCTHSYGQSLHLFS